jgi:hypothetical protein
VQVFDTANEAGGWVELSSIADPIPETYAGGSQYLAATNEGEVYTVSAFVKKVRRPENICEVFYVQTLYNLAPRFTAGLQS